MLPTPKDKTKTVKHQDTPRIVVRRQVNLCDCLPYLYNFKKEKSQTVIFHACADTTHADTSLLHLEVKVGSPTALPTVRFVAIPSGVLVPLLAYFLLFLYFVHCSKEWLIIYTVGHKNVPLYLRL